MDFSVLYRGTTFAGARIEAVRSTAQYIPLIDTASNNKVTFLDLSTDDSAGRLLMNRRGLIRQWHYSGNPADGKVLKMPMPGIKLDKSNTAGAGGGQTFSAYPDGLWLRASSYALPGYGITTSAYSAVTVRINKPLGLSTFDELWLYYTYDAQKNGANGSNQFAYNVVPDQADDYHALEVGASGGATRNPLPLIKTPGDFYLWVEAQSSCAHGGGGSETNVTRVNITKIEWRNGGNLVAFINFLNTKMFPADQNLLWLNSPAGGDVKDGVMPSTLDYQVA